MKKLKSQSGAALLIVLLFIALVSAMAFTIGRQMLSEFILSINAGNSTAAYYAAEAGLEDGLLRYKLDHNYQTVSQTIAIDNKTKYDLTMGYKTTGDVNGKLCKEQSVELIVNEGMDNNGRMIRIDIDAGNLPNNGWQGWQLVQYGSSGAIIKKNFYETMLGDNLVLTGVSKIKLKAMISPGGIDTCADYTITNDKNASIDSGITTITSVGFVGKNVRKLELQIDRATGATIGFLDYALYAGGDVPGGSIK